MENIIFEKQDYELTLNAETDISAMTVTQIHFKKPNKKALYKRAAVLVGTDYLRIDVTDTTNNVPGDWQFRIYVEDVTGRKYKGTWCTVPIQKDWL